MRIPRARTRCDWLGRLPKGTVGAEIGVMLGQFTEQIVRIAEPRHVYAVDHWYSWVRKKPVRQARITVQLERMRKTLGRLAPQIASGKVRVLCATSAEAAEMLGDQTLNWVYIDAHHSYAAVLEDLSAWYPKVVPGGLIAGHDYEPTEHPHKVAAALGDFMASTFGADLPELHTTTEEHPASFWFRKPGRS